MRLLVIDGNPASVNALNVAAGGSVASRRYGEVLTKIAPEARLTIIHPADGPANLPNGVGLADFDGAAITGSALNIYDGGPAVARQIELARDLLSAGVPVFGSCWGLQVGAAALGGDVRRNARGREIGFARRISRLPAGRDHPLLHGKPETFEAFCVHFDEVAAQPAGMIVLAHNAHSAIQAAEWRDARSGAIFWGVQYHPEYEFSDIAAVMRRYADSLIQDGTFACREDMARYLADLDALQAQPDRPDLAWRYGVDVAVRDPGLRERELTNWIALIRARRAGG